MSKSAMFKKIVPVAIVALTAFASVGTAVAHESIIARPGFDEALASLQSASSSQTQSVAQRSTAQSVSNVSPYNPGASSDDSGWFKDR